MEAGEGRSTRRDGEVVVQSAGAGGGEGELREPSRAESSVVKNRRLAHTDYQKRGGGFMGGVHCPCTS